MKNKRKICLIIISVIIILLGIIAICYFVLPKKETTNPIKVLDSIDNYSYSLKENDSKLKKSLFKELDNELKKSEIDYKLYAELLSKIFIVDIFSLDSKINKYDIGGLEYLYPSEVEKFKNIMSDTLYDIIENNADKKREQSLPLVKEVQIKELKDSAFTIDKEELIAYDITLEWSYEEDLGYDTSANIIVVKKDDKLYIVSYKPI